MELVLLFSAVLVFRSMWNIMDSIPFLNEIDSNIIMLFLGIILSVYATSGLSAK